MYQKKQTRSLVIFFYIVPLALFFFLSFCYVDDVSLNIFCHWTKELLSVWKTHWPQGSRVCLSCFAWLSLCSCPFFLYSHGTCINFCSVQAEITSLCRAASVLMSSDICTWILVACAEHWSLTAPCHHLAANLKGFVLPAPSSKVLA